MNQHKQLLLSETILSVLTALAVCLFLGLCYPHHLHYQEQFQLFLYQADYACDVLSMPGGLADYLGRFLTQFFLYAWVGATLTGLLVGGIVALTARQLRNNGWLSCLAVLPALLLARFVCDEDALLGGIVALLLSLLAAGGVTRIAQPTVRLTVGIGLLPVCYWLAGPLALLYVLLFVNDETSRSRKSRPVALYLLLIGVVLLALLLPRLVAPLLPVEPWRLYVGVHYLRTPGGDTTWLWLTPLSIVLPAMYAKNGPHREAKGWMTLTLAAILGTGGACWLVGPAVNRKAETVMAYDFMARMQQWNRIQQTAERQAPNNALCATVLNLALAKTGRMGDHLFEYQQRGTSGLLPDFQNDAMSPLATSEVYYHLGMINTAQRFTFEAQEAILDFQKSARCYKRLAETNLILGNYQVARKYLTALQHTLFYRDWAEQTLALLGKEEAIAAHKEYGELRKNLMKPDTFFSNYEYVGMLKGLSASCQQNRMAFEYLLCACLLQKDLDSFVEAFLMNTALTYRTLPVHFQQALLLKWSQQHAPSDPMPQGIQPEVWNGMQRFMTDVQQQRMSKEGLKKRYGETYWYYYFY